MLGWTMPDGREMFTVAEFIEQMTFERITLGGPIFDLEKLTWLNGKYFRETKTDDDLTELFIRELFSPSRIRKIVPLIRERIDKAEDFVPSTQYFFSGDVTLDPAALKPKGRTYKELAQMFEDVALGIDAQADFSPPALEVLCRGFAEARGWNTRDLFMPVRVAITAARPHRRSLRPCPC